MYDLNEPKGKKLITRSVNLKLLPLELYTNENITFFVDQSPVKEEKLCRESELVEETLSMKEN